MIHLVFNIDSKYVPHCFVTLTSIFCNNPAEEFSVHIITFGLTEEDIRLLSGLCNQHKATLAICLVDIHRLDGFKVRRATMSKAAYLRCFMSEVLPAGLEKVLYMDCDIVVRGHIEALWQTPIEDYALAAVPDAESDTFEDLQRLLGHATTDLYFNSGVMLVNLAYWRKHSVHEACMDFYRKHEERMKFHDQDLLNAVLHGKVVLLELKWNAIDAFYSRRRFQAKEWVRKGSRQLANPAVLHFTARKPWDYKCLHPMRNEYFRYLAKTPFHMKSPWRHTKMRLMQMLHGLLYTLRLKRKRFYTFGDMKRFR